MPMSSPFFLSLQSIPYILVFCIVIISLSFLFCDGILFVMQLTHLKRALARGNCRPNSTTNSPKAYGKQFSSISVRRYTETLLGERRRNGREIGFCHCFEFLNHAPMMITVIRCSTTVVCDDTLCGCWCRKPHANDLHGSLAEYWKASHLQPLGRTGEQYTECVAHKSDDVDPYSCAAVAALAEIHVTGWKGVQPADISCAIQLYNESAKCGNETAQYVVGVLSAYGLFGFPKSEATSILYYHFAALGGSAAAQAALAFRHQMGISVPSQCSSASLYFSAATQDDVIDTIPSESLVLPKKQRLSEDAFDLIGNQESDETQLTQYFINSAELGHPRARVALGHFYYYGTRSLPRNFYMAAKYLHEAIEPVVEQLEEEGSEIKHEKGLSAFEDIVPGSSTAMAILGQLYLEGAGVERNIDVAIDFLTEVADRGHPMALTTLAKANMFGIGVSQDVSKAMSLLNKAASMGSSDAHYNLGMMYLSAGRSEALRESIRKFAESEDAAKQIIAEISERITRDFRMAYKHFSTCSQNGHVNCAYALAQMHLHGLGTEVSCPAALQHLSKAFQNGRFALNLQQAYLLLVQADSREGTFGILKTSLRDSITTQMVTVRGIIESQLAKIVFPLISGSSSTTQSSEQGRVPSSKFEMRRVQAPSTPDKLHISDASPFWGYYEVEPAGSPKDLRIAALFKYLLAAEQGFELAQWNAAILMDQYQDDILDVMSTLFPGEQYIRETTETLLERASSQNNVDAYLKRGDYRYYGHATAGIPPDAVEAASYYRTAADMGNAQAMYNIGMMYETGDGLPSDLHLAKRYYDLALSRNADSLVPVKIAKIRLWLRAIWWAIYARNKQTLSRENVLGDLTPSEIYQLLSSSLQVLSEAYASDLDSFISSDHAQDSDRKSPPPEHSSSKRKEEVGSTEKPKIRPIADAQEKHSRENKVQTRSPFEEALEIIYFWADVKTLTFLALLVLIYVREVVRRQRAILVDRMQHQRR